MCISSNILHFFRHRAGSPVLIWLRRVFRILYKVSIVRSSNSCKGNTRKCYILSLSQKNALFAKFFVRLESLLDIFGMETRDWREKLAGNEAKNRTKNSQKLLKNSNVR